jgi:flagellar motor switch protein FliM
MLYKVFETTAYQISREVSNFLRATAKVSLNSIDELSFEIFKNTCPEIMYINTLRLKPLKGFGCIAMDMGLCLSIVEKAFGGAGKTQNEIRKLTDTESSIVGNIVRIILEKIGNSWKPFDEMEWTVSDTAMEPRYLNIASEAEVVLLVSFTFNLEYCFGEMKFCVPVSSVDHTFDHFFSNRPSNTKENDTESAESLKKLASNLKIAVTGVMDETNFTVNDVATLKVGDVLRLDNKITNNLKVFVEGKNKFYGKLGLYGSKKAMQIIGLSDEEFN